MNVALFQNKYDEMAKRVLVDEYMKPVDEKENAFAERQITISKINGMVDKIGFMEGAMPIVASQTSDLSAEIRIEAERAKNALDGIKTVGDIIDFENKNDTYEVQVVKIRDRSIDTSDGVAKALENYPKDTEIDFVEIFANENFLSYAFYDRADDKFTFNVDVLGYGEYDRHLQETSLDTFEQELKDGFEFLGIGDVIGYSLPDPVREDISSFYYVDKIPAYKEKELFTQYGQEETVDKIAHTVSWQRELHSDDELLGVMEKAMDMSQYRLLDDKDFNIVHGRTWASEEELLAMIKEGRTDFAIVSDVESFYVDWDIIEETLKNADLTADDVFGEVPDEYLSQVKESLEGEVTPNFNSRDGYYETSAYTHGEISDILDDISASNLHLSFDLETQDRKDFGCYNRLFAVVTDADGLQALYRLPVLVNDETGELETLSDVCKKVQLYCSQINDDEYWIKVADSDDIFNRAITDLSLEDDRRELQVEITNFTAYEYSPVQQKEQAETLQATQSKMTCITMQDLEDEGFVNMLKNKNNNNIPR